MKYDIGHKMPSDSIPGDFYLLDLFHGPILSSMENLENTSKKEENKYHLESHIREQVYILLVFSMTIFTYSLIYMFIRVESYAILQLSFFTLRYIVNIFNTILCFSAT